MNEIRDMHEPLCRWLREQGIEFIRARSDRESTIESGWEDFTILDPRKPALLIELKTDKGKLSPAQIAVIERHKSRGFTPHVVRTLEAAMELVREWRSDVKAEQFRVTAKGCFIRNVPGFGDYVASGNANLRKATPADVATYPRGT